MQRNKTAMVSTITDAFVAS